MSDILADTSNNMEFFELIFDKFIELHGDRKSGDDPAVVGGLGRIGKYKIVVVNYQSSDKHSESNFSISAGYRKIIRLMKLAKDFNKPVVTFVNVPVLPSLSISEQQIVDESIARSVRNMSQIKVPVVNVIMGESDDIKAIDLCAGDRIFVLDDGTCHTSSSEKGWIIDFGNESLCLNTQQLLDMNIVHKAFTFLSQKEQASVATQLKEAILEELRHLSNIDPDVLIKERLKRLQNQFLNFGVFRSSQNATDKIN
ncbi:hypothetical protein GF312_05140 [Candidatus Poribacteria bacterium]|nr:hypothetical protein [Candidatus Poribacteria bacterium]